MAKYQVGQQVEFYSAGVGWRKGTIFNNFGPERTVSGLGPWYVIMYNDTQKTVHEKNIRLAIVAYEIPHDSHKYNYNETIEFYSQGVGWRVGRITVLPVGNTVDGFARYMVNYGHDSSKVVSEKNIRSHTYAAEILPELPSLWYAKFTLDQGLAAFGIPKTLMNPHFMNVIHNAPLEKNILIQMSAGMMREVNPKIRLAKFYAVRKTMEQFGVYMPISMKQLITGGNEAKQIYIAAIMECYTPTGLYNKKVVGY